MKKNLLYLSILLTSLIFCSCEKETEGISSTIDIELFGGQLMLVAVDEPFVDPGVEAKYKGVDITNSITKTGTVDYNTVGIYTIDYTYINDDGVATTRTRARSSRFMSIPAAAPCPAEAFELRQEHGRFNLRVQSPQLASAGRGKS